MLSLALTQRSSRSEVSGLSVPFATIALIVSRLVANFLIVSNGPEREIGGIVALTRLPSGRRASTIGEDSSIRRPT